MIVEVPFVYEANAVLKGCRNERPQTVVGSAPVDVREISQADFPILARARSGDAEPVEYRFSDGALYWGLAPWEIAGSEPLLCLRYPDSQSCLRGWTDAFIGQTAQGYGGCVPWRPGTWVRPSAGEVFGERDAPIRDWLRDDRDLRISELKAAYDSSAIAMDGGLWFRTSGPAWILKSGTVEASGGVCLDVCGDLDLEWQRAAAPSRTLAQRVDVCGPCEPCEWSAFVPGEEALAAQWADRMVRRNACGSAWEIPVSGSIEVLEPAAFAVATAVGVGASRIRVLEAAAYAVLDHAAEWDFTIRGQATDLLEVARSINLPHAAAEQARKSMARAWEQKAFHGVGISRRQMHGLEWNGRDALADRLSAGMAAPTLGGPR